MTSKICSPHLNNVTRIFFMTSHLNSHGTTDIEPEMLSVVQTGNGTQHYKYYLRGIALTCTKERRHFHAKTTSAKLYIYIGVGSRDLFIDEAHTALDIFHFFPCVLPSPLCGIFSPSSTFFIEGVLVSKNLFRES